MGARNESLQELMDKIQSLPPEQFVEVEDFVDFLQHRRQTEEAGPRKPLDFPVISAGQWPQGFSLRREDLYGDDGR